MSSRSSHQLDDEISLVDIWFFLVRQRFVIGACVLLALLAGVAFVYFRPKTYQVEVNIDKPWPEDLAPLNLALSPAALTGFEPVTPDQAFNYVARHFRREKSLQRLYKESWLPLQENSSGQSWSEAEYRALKGSLQITRPDEKRNALDHTLRVSADDPAKAVNLAKAYLQIVQEESRVDLLKDLENARRIRLEDVTRQIQLDRVMYQRGVSDRLVQLNEALSIAKTAGVVDPVVLSARLPAQDKLRESADNNALYTLGAKNLSAEIDALSQRADDEPFIANLRLNQSKKEALEKIDLARFPVVTFQPDREIQEPQYGTPRKSTVLAVSALLGLGLGLAFAVGRAFLDHVHSAQNFEEDLFSQLDHGNGASHRGRSKSPLTTAR